MICTDEAWQPGRYKADIVKEYGKKAVLEEVNAPPLKRKRIALDRRIAREAVEGCGKNGAPCRICRLNGEMVAGAVRAAIIRCAAVAGRYAAAGRMFDSADARQKVRTAEAIDKAILRLIKVTRK